MGASHSLFLQAECGHELGRAQGPGLGGQFGVEEEVAVGSGAGDREGQDCGPDVVDDFLTLALPGGHEGVGGERGVHQLAYASFGRARHLDLPATGGHLVLQRVGTGREHCRRSDLDADGKSRREPFRQTGDVDVVGCELDVEVLGR